MRKQNTERGDRVSNLIIHRVPESKATSQEERRREDEVIFERLCEEALQVGKVQYNKVFRLGPPKEGKIRPIKVMLTFVEDKTTIMSNLKKLQNAEEPFKGLSLANDLTQDEREERNRLVAEAKKQTEEDESGEWTYKVRGPPWDQQIVKLKKIQ